MASVEHDPKAECGRLHPLALREGSAVLEANGLPARCGRHVVYSPSKGDVVPWSSVFIRRLGVTPRLEPHKSIGHNDR